MPALALPGQPTEADTARIRLTTLGRRPGPGLHSRGRAMCPCQARQGPEDGNLQDWGPTPELLEGHTGQALTSLKCIPFWLDSGNFQNRVH